jgi:hypothetical protein
MVIEQVQYIRRSQLYGRMSEHSLKWRCDIGLCQRLTAKTLMMAAESDTETLVLNHTMMRLLCEDYLGVFTKLRKSTISFVMSVSLSVRLSVRLEQLVSNWRNFHEIWYFGNFPKSVKKIQVTLKTGKNKRYVTWRPIDIYNISLSSSYNETSFKRKL